MGEVFAGRYELVDPLGAGGMGSVWRAWDHRARAYVAAKVLRQGDASALLRFVREQSFRIHHPNVVTPRNWAGEDERVLFTMELIRGGTLSLLLQRYGRLSPQWVAVLTDQILAALSAVHEAGLVHRDIKPGNIMLQPTGRARPVAKLMDFGVAVPVNEPRLTRASQMLGTPGYLAPEVFAGADPEPRHDVYSMGVLAAEMLSGRRPDPDSGISVTGPENVPPAIWEYVRKLGAWDVADRPESCLQARQLLAELEILPAEGVAPEDPTGRVQVFDVVGPLPSGWGPDGPLPGPHGAQQYGGPRPLGAVPVPGQVPSNQLASSPGPGQPNGPGQSGGPGQPNGPGQPGGMGQPSGPGQANGPGQPSGLGQQGGAGQPSAPGQPSGPGQQSGPGHQGGAGQLSGPGQPSGSGQSSGLGQSSGPGQAPGSMQPGGPSSPGQGQPRTPMPGGGQQPPGGGPAGHLPVNPTRGVTPPTSQQRSATPVQPRNLAPSQSPPAQSGEAGETDPPKRKRRWPLAVASILLVVAGLVLGSSIWWADPLFGADDPSGKHTQAPSNGPTSAPFDPTATAGGACDFTEVGTQAQTSAGDVLVCRKDGGAYVWKTP